MIFSNCVLQKFTSFNSTRNLHNFESLHYLRDCRVVGYHMETSFSHGIEASGQLIQDSATVKVHAYVNILMTRSLAFRLSEPGFLTQVTNKDKPVSQGF